MSPAVRMPTRTQAPTDQPLAPPDADQPKVETSPRADKDGQHPGTPMAPGVPLAPPGIPPESDVRVQSPSAAQPPPSHAQFDARLGELPSGYGDGRLVALIRDPSTLYVYWDFAPLQVEQAFFALGNARAVAKLWNVRGGAGEALVREQDVHLEARGWYLHDLPPGTELRVEVWAVGEKGSRLLRAARPVRLPPATPSDQHEAFYLRVPLDHSLREGLYRGSPLQYGGAAPSEWDRRVHPRVMPDSSPSRFPPGTELRVEVWAVGEKGSRLLRAARPVRLPPATPSDQHEAFYLRVPLDHSLREGLYRGSPLQYGGAAPSEWDRRVHPRVMPDSSPSRFPPGTLANQIPTAVPFGSSPAGSPWGSSPGGHFFGTSPGGHLFGSSPEGILPWDAPQGPHQADQKDGDDEP
jgi:hypothetical protein